MTEVTAIIGATGAAPHLRRHWRPASSIGSKLSGSVTARLEPKRRRGSCRLLSDGSRRRAGSLSETSYGGSTMSFERALVIGAGSGVGQATAAALNAQGVHVVASGRERDATDPDQVASL